MLPTLSLSHFLDPTLVLRLAFVAVLVVTLGRYIQQLVAIRRKYDGIPSPPTSWILGNLLGHMESFIRVGSKLNVTIILGNVVIGMSKLVHEMGEGLFYFRVGPFRHIVAAMTAKTAEAILTDTRNVNKAAEYDFMKPWLGEGLITGRGPHWRRHRKLLTPTFHFQILNKFIPVMNYQLKTFCSIIESKMGKNNKAVIEDMRPIVTNCAVDIICQTAMGIEMNAQKAWIRWNDSGADEKQKTPESEYVDSLRSFLDTLLNRLISPWLYPDFLFHLFPSGRRFRRSIATMHAYTNNVIMKRREELKKKFDKSLTVEESIKRVSEGSRVDFLDLLLVYNLKDTDEFDLVSIREEVDTFMFGGHDTTSTTMQFAMMLIGLNQDKQKLIHEELDSIFYNDFERDITSDDTKQMVYLEMCIKETLRLYPSVAFFARTIIEDLQCDKFLIPEGTTFVVSSYSVHRDPAVYEHPEHFIPERFAPNSSVTRHPFAFIPFSAGPRNCIGQRYAMLEMKIVLATILRKYSIRSLTKQENVHLDFAIISKSHTPFSIEFTRREVTTN